MSNLTNASTTLRSPRFDAAGARLEGAVKCVADLSEGERDENDEHLIIEYFIVQGEHHKLTHFEIQGNRYFT